MAVTTDGCGRVPDELAEILRVRWGLSGVWWVARHQSYPTRTVYRIGSHQGEFAVKVDAEPGELVDGSEVVQAAAHRALPAHVPQVRSTVDDELAVVVCGRRVTVGEDIGGGHPSPTPTTWARLGEILARLHNTASATRPYVVPIPGAVAELTRLATRYPFAEEYRKLIPRVSALSTSPAATIHGEVNGSNVLCRPSGEIVLIDWDNAGTGPIALDLGYPLICVFLAVDLAWHDALAAAFYGAYRRHRTTPAPPAPQIFNAALMHAMRYLQFADHARRWARIQYALDHERELTAAADVT